MTRAVLHGRRLEVAKRIAEGLSNKEIGSRLGIAPGTVKNHVHAVLGALGVEHRWQVAAALQVQIASLASVHGTRLGITK
jgi:DNA-binding NarL/FixJ family response regulator